MPGQPHNLKQDIPSVRTPQQLVISWPCLEYHLANAALGTAIGPLKKWQRTFPSIIRQPEEVADGPLRKLLGPLYDARKCTGFGNEFLALEAAQRGNHARVFLASSETRHPLCRAGKDDHWCAYCHDALAEPVPKSPLLRDACVLNVVDTFAADAFIEKCAVDHRYEMTTKAANACKAIVLRIWELHEKGHGKLIRQRLA